MGGARRRLVGHWVGFRKSTVRLVRLNPEARSCERRASFTSSPIPIALHLILLLTAVSNANLLRGADITQPTSAAPTLSATTVGALGRPEAIVLEGNRSFSGDTIRSALGDRMEFLLAGHPAAPLADYAPALEKMIRTAYLRQGFPEVQVKANVEVDKARVRVPIKEGPRFKTGQIRFVGVKGRNDPLLQKKLRDALTSGEASVIQGFAVTSGKVLWNKDAYAPFDEGATAEVKERVLAELAELNYYKPTLKIAVVPVPGSRQGDLVIEMTDEGLKGTIDDFGFFYPVDDKKNTDAEIEQYLGLQPGMPLRANLPSEITNRLWLSGRFLKQEANIVPLPDEGHFKLEVDLEDLDEAPPLRQPLSTNETAVLKLCAWLNEFPRHPEDLVFSVQGRQGDQSIVDAELVLSKSGLAWLLRNDQKNREPRLAYAMVLASNTITCYAAWHEHRLIGPAAGSLTAFVSVLPNGQAKGDNRYNLTIGAGVSTEKSDQPIDILLRLAPVKFLELAGQDKTRYKPGGTELEVLFPTTEEVEPVMVRIDRTTGRLVSSRFEMGTNGIFLTAQARSEKGGYDRLIREISAAPITSANDYTAAYPKSSWVGFFLSDLLESGVLESSAVSNFTAQAYSPSKAAALVVESRQIRMALGQLKTALGQPDLAGCLRPFEDTLNRFFKIQAGPVEPGSQDFYIPLQPGPDQNSMTVLLGMVAAYVIDKTDAIWPRNSWPWTLARETGFTITGQNPYTAVELDRLFTSAQTGPLGCWAAAALLARLNAPLAEKFARRSLEHLNLQQFEMDLGLLFAPENAAGQIAAKALAQLAQLKESDVDALSVVLGTEVTRLARQTALVARSETNHVPLEVLRPALSEAWNGLLRPEMASAVNALLRKVGTPENPEAAFDRANFILQTANKPEEFNEAARALELAANKGLAQAQLRLGYLYQNGQGVPLDYHEALNWFTKAADQGEPHAACRIGDIYFQGQGVEVDKAAAMAWYDRDARRGCPRSQFQLGLCAEQQYNPTQALAWYRLAATNGFAEAQTTLAERLSDELQTAPDYPEAYLWYRIAADAGNRVAAVSARRLKSKLTPAQLEQADKEARRISKRINQMSSAQ